MPLYRIEADEETVAHVEAKSHMLALSLWLTAGDPEERREECVDLRITELDDEPVIRDIPAGVKS